MADIDMQWEITRSLFITCDQNNWKHILNGMLAKYLLSKFIEFYCFVNIILTFSLTKNNP